MKTKFTLVLVVLSILSVFTIDSDNRNITIDKAIGDLYEYVKLQQIKLSIVPTFNIDPKKLYDFELKRGFKSYKIPLNCLKAESQKFSLLVSCDINLSDVPLGTYVISKFNYTNITYLSNAYIKIKEVDDKKISDIKLDKATGNLKEFQLTSRPINFEFSETVDYKKLNTIKIEDKDKNEYKINLYLCDSAIALSHNVHCNPNIKIKAGTYKLIYVQYDKEIILPSNNIDIIIAEDNLELESAYNYHGREVCAGKLNSLLFNFEDYSMGIFLSKIFFKNIKSNKIYEPRFEYLYNPHNGGSSVEMIFDFFGMPPGKYTIDYIYKNRLIKSQFVIEIIRCKPIDYSELYES